MAGELICQPLASVHFDIVEAEDAVAVSLIVAELPLVAQSILVVQDTMAVSRSIFAAFSLVPQFMLAASDCELVVVIDVPQHIAYHLLTVPFSLTFCWFFLFAAGLARSCAKRKVKGLSEVFNEHPALGLALVLIILSIGDIPQLSFRKQPSFPSVRLLSILIRRYLSIVPFHADRQRLVLTDLLVLMVKIRGNLPL